MENGRAAIVFYRSHLQSGDIAPIEALASALAARGLGVRAFYVASLKEPSGAQFVAAQMRGWRPDVVLNATAFSAPLEAGGAVVLQVVLAGSSRERWAASSRGLAGTDLAMHVALPELDGRLLTGAISFKREMAPVPGLEFARTVHAPCGCGIAMAADRALGWARLAQIRATGKAPVLGCVLSDYPGGGRVGHAVGLDTFASLEAILGRMGSTVSAAALVDGLCHATAQPTVDLATYHQWFDALPVSARAAVLAAWGDAEHDPAVVDGAFTQRFMRAGAAVLAVQPDRGAPGDRKAGYHSPDCPPRHGFIAFYLWLRHTVGIDAMLHVGAHGTLEWLPGKSVALSRGCFPALLTGGVPVIYPFIVNNPGEAAAAKRRLGAVTIGHMTPPLRAAGGNAALETLLEEYAGADGMDRRRTALLRRSILDLAETTGLLAESGASADLPEDDRLARLGSYLCDVKDAQIRDGLHVFGDAPGEWEGLEAALAGRFVAPGPAGAPSRGRADVLPTGRNLYAIDPRAVPTPAAMTLAAGAAAELLRRHLQDHGEYPRSLVLNLWGSTTMRTGGEDLALAMILLGVAPLRDEASGRVTGFEVVPLALLDRPRIDVTLRISGLFRDAFGMQIELFDAAVRAVAARDEATDWNPLAGATATRVFGPAPGCYGAGVGAALDAGRWADRGALGAAYLEASSTGYGRNAESGDFAALARAADAYVQVQDHRETDVLEGSEFAAHTGGFAALADRLGAAPALYHADTGAPDAPRVRTASEEVVRIVRARAANPVWLAGMRRHGYRGAAEIARSLDGLFAYAATVPHRFDAQFELLWGATLGDAEVDGFLRAANPEARDGMRARFDEARARGIWHPKRNDFTVTPGPDPGVHGAESAGVPSWAPGSSPGVTKAWA